jgi:Fur family transcriptional regulator, peroxide stress response regulator
MMDHKIRSVLDEALAGNGLRMTRQRQVVYEVVMAERSHPTAEEVHRQVRLKMPSVSLATVYNCLDTLVDCGLIRQVNRDRDSSRYCGNLKRHGHFHCSTCGSIHDIDLTENVLTQLAPTPASGFRVQQFEIIFRGLCPVCQKKGAPGRSS